MSGTKKKGTVTIIPLIDWYFMGRSSRIDPANEARIHATKIMADTDPVNKNANKKSLSQSYVTLVRGHPR